MRTLYKVSYSLIVGFLMACSTDTVEPTADSVGFSYFPLETLPDTVWYQVDEINYRNDGTVDSSSFIIYDAFISTDSIEQQKATIREGYRIESRDGNQEVISTIRYTASANGVLAQYGNSQERVLSFPIEENKSWIGKTVLTITGEEQDDIYQYENTYQPYALQDSTFQNSIQVIQENNEDSTVFFDKRMEIYAPDLGMIYKLNSQITFCNETECLGQQIIEFGTTRRMTRIFKP